MQGTIRLPRPVLPRELTSPESDLTKLVIFAGDMRPDEPNRQVIVAKTRDFLRRACHSYRPSFGNLEVVCRSGEDNQGKPYRGDACAQCQVGQFSSSMVFVGAIAPAPRRPQVHQ